MRVLVLNWLDRENPTAGGAELHLHETFGRIARMGHQVVVLASGWPGAEARVELDGMEVHRAGGRYSFLFAGPRRARRLLAERTFDVVVEDLNKVPLFSPLWTRLPVVGLVHHLFGSSALAQAGPAIGTATWLLERPLPRLLKGREVIAVSRSTADDLVRRGLDRRHLSVVHNGVDTAFYQARQHERSANPLLLYLGRLKRYKRVDLVIDALAHLRESGSRVRLVVAGDGDHRPELERRVRDRGLDAQVQFEGVVSEERKRELYHQAWIHVLTSEKEGWGLSVVEAGACGTPSVASDSPGLAEAVKHEQTGLLVSHGDARVLAAALARLLNDHEERARMGVEARKWAESLTWDRTAVETLQVLELARERSPSQG